MSNVVRSAAVRLTMDNAAYIRGTNQSATVTEQATGRMQRAVRGATVSTGRDWDTMGKYGGRTALAIGVGLGYAEKRILSFDKTMSTVSAVTEANAATQAKLRAAAIQAGADTAFTATEAAQAIAEEGKAGITTANILKGGLRGALNLAAAGSIGVAEAAEDMSTALVQFHLDGNQATHVADLLAAASNKAQGEVGDMSLALSYIGVPAHAARISLEETVGTIALLAKNGLIGEKAGTSLRGMLASLQSPSKQAQKIMKNLGIEVFDTSGRFKGFDGVAQVLHDRLGGLTDQERQFALGKIFGNEQLQAANILYEKGARGVHRMTREVNDQGYASEVANKKLDNLAGDWEKFTGTLEADFIKAGTGAQGALRDIVQGADSLAHAFGALPEEIQAGIVKVAVLTAGIGGTLYVISKIRNVARDLRGVGRGGGRGGGLAGAASLAAPVPVFVVNMGAGALGGIGAGGKGGTTILGGGGAGAEGKIRGFRLPRGTGLVATLGGLALMLTGTTDKTHSGSTVGGALAGGQILGPLGAAGGGIIGGAIDIYHAGGSTKNVIDEAKAALASGDIKRMTSALADLQAAAAKIGNGGPSQNFNAFVTQITGRRGEIEDVGRALEEAINPKERKETRQSLAYLLTVGEKGRRAKPPGSDVANPFDTLLDPNRKGHKRPKQMSSRDVLADLYGIDTRKLKPVDLLGEITGLAGGVWTGKGKGPSKKATAKAFAVSLGMDTTNFDRDWKAAKKSADILDKVIITPSLKVTGVPEAISATDALKRLIDSLHDRNIHIKVTKTTNATLADAVANNGGGKDGDPTTAYGAGGYTGAGDPRDPAGIVHRREYVFSAEATRGNEPMLERLHRRLRGYGDGGLVGGLGSVSAASVSRLDTPIDYGKMAAAHASNQLLGQRDTRDVLVSALRTVLRETPILRAPQDLSALAGVS